MRILCLRDQEHLEAVEGSGAGTRNGACSAASKKVFRGVTCGFVGGRNYDFGILGKLRRNLIVLIDFYYIDFAR